MLLSYIIPTLNEEKYLPLLLESIKNQKVSDYEVIVSDGGSNDKTASIAREAGCRFVVDSTVKHPSHQRNVGAALAQGELFLFLDADTVLPDNFTDTVLTEFQSRDLVGAGFYIKFSPNRPLYSLFAFFLNQFLFIRQYFAPAAVGAGIISRNLAHHKINGFDETIYVAEDYDYCFRLSRLGRFRMIKSVKLPYSSRRLEKDGKFRTLFKWLKMATFTLFNLKIKKKIVKYDFGKY
ncbi:MAG: glycosyltransferase [Patescibacteria group bacterium]